MSANRIGAIRSGQVNRAGPRSRSRGLTILGAETRLRKAYVAASSMPCIKHGQGASKRSDGGLGAFVAMEIGPAFPGAGFEPFGFVRLSRTPNSQSLPIYPIHFAISRAQ
jgi:hypothetical protein